MEKARFDIAREMRKLNRQTLIIAFSAGGLVVAAFAAGAWWAQLYRVNVG